MGHNHSYQRTCPVYNETCTTDGVTHVVIGMGGALLSGNPMPVTQSGSSFKIVSSGVIHLFISSATDWSFSS